MKELERDKLDYIRLISDRMLSIELNGLKTNGQYIYGGRFQSEFDDETDEKSGFVFGGGGWKKPTFYHVAFAYQINNIEFLGKKIGAEVKVDYSTFDYDNNARHDQKTKQDHIVVGKIVKLLISPDEISTTILILF